MGRQSGYTEYGVASKHTDFEWDAQKATTNYRKHRVRFEHAAEALASDPRAVEDVDPHHEERVRSLALGTRGLLFVVWTAVAAGVTRVISAGLANR